MKKGFEVVFEILAKDDENIVVLTEYVKKEYVYKKNRSLNVH